MSRAKGRAFCGNHLPPNLAKACWLDPFKFPVAEMEFRSLQEAGVVWCRIYCGPLHYTWCPRRTALDVPVATATT